MFVNCPLMYAVAVFGQYSCVTVLYSLSGSDFSNVSLISSGVMWSDAVIPLSV